MTSVLFVGPGAIASLMCWQLQGLARPWVFRHRPDLTLPARVVEADREIPLDWTFPPVGVDFADIDLVVVACKATQVETAVTPLLPHLGRATWLICCNGLGPQHWLAEQCPGRVLWASTTEGAARAGRRVYHTGRGETRLGAPPRATLSDATRALAGRLCDHPGPLDWRWDEAIEFRLWLKLAINAVINPLTAVAGVDNGVLADPAWRGEIERLCGEIAAVAEHSGQRLPGDLADRVIAVARATAANCSSMRCDVEAGRPTEIEYINGYLIRRALAHGLEVPRLLHWYRAVIHSS